MATDGIVPPASASGAGSSTHPSVDELADLHAGALDDERARQIMPHVRRCAECTAVLDTLSAVQAELRALPTPVMPASVAERLDAALAAERDAAAAPTNTPDSTDSAATTQLPIQAEPPGRGPVVDLDRERMRRRRRVRLIGVAAAGVVLVGGGVIVGSQLTETDSGQIQAEQPGVSESAEQSAGNSGGAGPIDGPPQANRYDQDSLQSGIGDVLQKGQLEHEDQAGDPDVAGDMAAPANRLRCLQALPQRPQGATLAVQFVEYEGDPAYVFVFAIPNNDDTVRVIVVPEECGTEPVEPIASFLAPR